MATVCLPDDLKHERKVALKVLKPELAANGRRAVDSMIEASRPPPHLL